jgi:hypothetical protein
LAASYLFGSSKAFLKTCYSEQFFHWTFVTFLSSHILVILATAIAGAYHCSQYLCFIPLQPVENGVTHGQQTAQDNVWPSF